VERHGWRDHMFFFTGDWGPCEFYPQHSGADGRGAGAYTCSHFSPT